MPVSRLQPTLGALFTSLALAACGSVEERLIGQGLPPTYAQGYAHGCASGEDAAGGLFAEARQDATRYGTDQPYTEGWDAGFEQCRRETAAMVRAARLRNPSRED